MLRLTKMCRRVEKNGKWGTSLFRPGLAARGPASLPLLVLVMAVIFTQ